MKELDDNNGYESTSVHMIDERVLLHNAPTRRVWSGLNIRLKLILGLRV